MISPEQNRRNPNAMPETQRQSAAAGDAADPARTDNISNQALLNFMSTQQTIMANQQKTLETISTAITSMTALLTAAQSNGPGTGPAQNPQFTHPSCWNWAQGRHEASPIDPAPWTSKRCS